MPNKFYRKGYEKERRIVIREKNLGNLAVRTAGSHGPFDVIVVNKYKNTIKFIQSKPKNMPKSQINVLLTENFYLNGNFYCEFTVE